ncbi:MAG: hypothetical protein HKM07_07600, partial [Chlamydiae bacterium]|nr:hypothetical protein [Chlamydiota bacterium]
YKAAQTASTDPIKAVEIAKEIPRGRLKWHLISNILFTATEAAAKETDKEKSMKTFTWVCSEADKIPLAGVKASAFKAILPNLPKDSTLAKEAEKKAAEKPPAGPQGRPHGHHRHHEGHHGHHRRHFTSKL